MEITLILFKTESFANSWKTGILLLLMFVLSATFSIPICPSLGAVLFFSFRGFLTLFPIYLFSILSCASYFLLRPRTFQIYLSTDYSSNLNAFCFPLKMPRSNLWIVIGSPLLPKKLSLLPSTEVQRLEAQGFSGNVMPMYRVLLFPCVLFTVFWRQGPHLHFISCPLLPLAWLQFGSWVSRESPE